MVGVHNSPGKGPSGIRYLWILLRCLMSTFLLRETNFFSSNYVFSRKS